MSHLLLASANLQLQQFIFLFAVGGLFCFALSESAFQFMTSLAAVSMAAGTMIPSDAAVRALTMNSVFAD